MWDELTTRELASLFWLIVFGVWASVVARSSVVAIVRLIMTSWQLLLSFAGFVGWVVAACWLAGLVGGWNTSLIKDTVLWTAVALVPTVMSASKAAKDPAYFKKAVVGAIGLSAVMQFVLNLSTFNTVIELVLQPIVVFLFGVEYVAGQKQETKAAQKLAAGLLGVLGAAVFVATAVGLVRSWRGIDAHDTGLAFGLSIWLPLALLPFVYLLAVLMGHGSNAALLSFRNERIEPAIRVKVAMTLGLNGDLRAIDGFRRSDHYTALARSVTFRDAFMHARVYLSEIRVERRLTKPCGGYVIE